MTHYFLGLAWAELKRRLLELPRRIRPRAIPACLAGILLLVLPTLTLGSNNFSFYVGPGTPFTLNAALGGFRTSAIYLSQQRQVEVAQTKHLSAFGGGSITNTWYFSQSGNDSTGTGAIATPFKTRAKANQLMHVQATCSTTTLGSTLNATSAMTSIGGASSNISALFPPSGLGLVGGWTGMTSGSTTLSTSSFTINLQTPPGAASSVTGLATSGTVYLAVIPSTTSPWYSGQGLTSSVIAGQTVYWVPVTYSNTTSGSLTGCTVPSAYNNAVVPNSTHVGFWYQNPSTGAWTNGIPFTYTGTGTGSFTGVTSPYSGSIATSALITNGGSMNLLFSQGDVNQNETATHSPANDNQYILNATASSGSNTVTLLGTPCALPAIGATLNFTTSAEGTAPQVVSISTLGNSTTLTLGNNLANTHAAGTGITFTGLSTLDVWIPNVSIGSYDSTGQSYATGSSRAPVFTAFSSTTYGSSSAGTGVSRGDGFYKTFSYAETNSVVYVGEKFDYWNPQTLYRKLGSIAQVDQWAGSFYQPQGTVTSASGALTSGSSVTITLANVSTNFDPTVEQGAAPFTAGGGTAYFGGTAITYGAASGNTLTGCHIASGSLTLVSSDVINGGTVYIHPYADVTPASIFSSTAHLNYQPVYQNCTVGIQVEDIDGTSIWGIQVVGYGATNIAGNFVYGIHHLANGSNAVVIKDCWVAFSANHEIGQTGGPYTASLNTGNANPIGSMGGGGIATWIRCFTRCDTLNDAPYVVYNNLGGSQMQLWECGCDVPIIRCGLQPPVADTSVLPFVGHTTTVTVASFNSYVSGATNLQMAANTAGGWANGLFTGNSQMQITFPGGTSAETVTITAWNPATGAMTVSPGLQYTNHTGTLTWANGPLSGSQIGYSFAYALEWGCYQTQSPFVGGGGFNMPDYGPIWNSYGLSDTNLCRSWAFGERASKHLQTSYDSQWRCVPLTAASQTSYSAPFTLGTETGGTYTLSYNGQTTASIPFADTASQITTACQTAFTNAPTPANISVAGTSPNFTLTIGAGNPATALTGTFSGLTGGSGAQVNAITYPTVTVANPTDLGTYTSSMCQFNGQWVYLQGGTSGVESAIISTSPAGSGSTYTGPIQLGSNLVGASRTEMWCQVGKSFGNNGWASVNQGIGGNCIVANGSYENYMPWGLIIGSMAMTSGPEPGSTALFLNDTILNDYSPVVHPTVSNAKRSLFNYASSSAPAPEFLHCRFHTIVGAGDLGGLDFNSTLQNNTGSQGPVQIYNSIISGFSNGEGQVVCGLGNSAANQDGNAYCGLLNQAGTFAGYNNDANAVSFGFLLPLGEPDVSFGLALTFAQEQNHLLPGSYTLQYDANWAPRPSTPQRGPYEPTYFQVPYSGGNRGNGN